MIRFSAISLVIIFAVIGYWFSDSARALQVSSVFDRLINGSPEMDQVAFETAALGTINQQRSKLGLSPLSLDEEIHDSLGRFAATHTRLAEMKLEPLFTKLQAEYPSAQFLSATVILDPRDETLQKKLATWEDVTSSQYDTVSTLVFRDGYRKGCVAVLARRLPDFDLETANREGGRFFQQCPHCGKSHSIVLNQQSQTLILACPNCSKPYDLLAADTEGRFRRASEFFDGIKVPGLSPELAPKERLLAIWTTVLNHCEYVHDQTELDRSEAWKTSGQTWKDASGDCEDTSILLADALSGAGIDARVAVGWNIHIGQHAWCVARIGHDQWILESTLKLKEGESPILRQTSETENEYQPEQVFDRNGLYLRNDGLTRAGCLDYWSAEAWLDIGNRSDIARK